MRTFGHKKRHLNENNVIQSAIPRHPSPGPPRSICQLIIEQLGGSIWIDPDYEEGSRFLFTHPIDKSDQGKEETR